MKVFEILRDDVKSVTAEQIQEKLKGFNWKYEFSDNLSMIAAGNRELEVLENQVYHLWKREPEKAITMWWESAPGGAPFGDLSTVPSFLIRLQEQEQ